MIIRMLVAVLAVIMFAATSVAAQGTKPVLSLPDRDTVICPATPTDARMDVYPRADGKLSVKQGAGLGLRPMFLGQPLEAYNHHRELNSRCGGTWVPEVILAGTLVWVDASGYVAYKADCGNRLVQKTMVVKPAPRPQPHARAFWQWLGGWIEWPFVTYTTSDPLTR